MSALSRIVRVAVSELHMALRSRRALVVTLLFAVVAGAAMYGTVSAFAAMEREVLAALGLPASDDPCSVTMTLWKSRPFQHVVGRLVGDELVFAGLTGQHPVVLAYAVGIIFQLVPLLTLLVAAPRVAEDLHGGTARYLLVRVTRTEWTLGLFFGEALMLAFATLVGALSAWSVVMVRLPDGSGLSLGPGIFTWSLRAWVYAFGWLGLFMGISHVARSGGKATALCILALVGTVIWTPLLGKMASAVPLLMHLDVLVPQSAKMLLWRSDFSAFLQGIAHLAALSFFYLSLGAAVFRGRDT